MVPYAQLLSLTNNESRKVYQDSIDTAEAIQFSFWLVAQAQNKSKGYTQSQLEASHLCINGLLVKHLSSVSLDYRHLYKQLVVNKLCALSVSFDLGVNLATQMRIPDYGAMFKLPTMTHTYAAQLEYPVYSHNSKCAHVLNEGNLRVMERLLDQMTNRTNKFAIGINVQTCPSLLSNPTTPSLLSLSVNRCCHPTTGDTHLDQSMREQHRATSRATFLVDLNNVDCCGLLNTLLEDDTIIKIVFDAENVSIIICIS